MAGGADVPLRFVAVDRMKHWKETEEILARVSDLASAGRSGALATVVRIGGSAYRRPGAKFLIQDDGGTLGGVSGGCLEADVRERARRDVIPTGTPRLLHYDTGSDDRVVWGLGLGCNGSVDVFVQRIDALAGVLPALREMLRGDSRFSVATVVSGTAIGEHFVLGIDPDARARGPLPDRINLAAARQRLAAGESGLDESDAGLVFTDVLSPPPHLVVCGAGDQEAQAIGNGLIRSGLVSCTIGTGGQLFDKLLVNSSGWGGDPEGYLRINAEKSKWYRFDADVRQFDYYEQAEARVREYVRQSPGRSLLIAGAVGLIIGAILRRR